MLIVIDGKNGVVESAGTGTVGPAFDRATQAMLRAGRTVTEVSLDGAAISSADRAAIFSRPVSDYRRMDLTTIETRELVTGTLTEVHRHLVPLGEALRSTLDSLRDMQRVRALETLRPTLEIWISVCEAITKVTILMGHDPARPLVGSTSVQDAQQAVLVMLEKTQQVFQERDWQGLASLIETEFLPLVDLWDSLCATLQSEVASPGA